MALGAEQVRFCIRRRGHHRVRSSKVFATLEGKRESFSGLSTELVARLRNFIANMGEKDRLEYVLATTTKLSEEDISYLENEKLIGQAKFGSGFDVDTVSIETIYRKLRRRRA